MEETALLIFAIGFFVFIMNYANNSLNNDHDRDYRHWLNERREFGREPERSPPDSTNTKKK